MSNPTTPFSWQMPTATDLVTDLPADFEVFGQAVATSMADLLGGTAGQVLSKTTNADMDFTWINNDQGDITGVTAGTGISGGGTSGTVTVTNSMATAIDAKGDLIGGTGADAFARLAIGANGTVLTADSAETTGMKWAAASGGTPTFVGCFIYGTANQTISNATVTTVPFGAENFDSDGFHDNATNNSRITIPTGKGGKYLVVAQSAFAANLTGFRQTRILKNGTAVQISVANNNASNTVDLQNNISYILSLAAADYIEMAVYQSSGGNLTLSNTNDNETFMSVTYLGA
jgi:hypothetical protein